MRHVIVGTAGHIDHGKTALVKALTGIDTDRLEEEKRRGISIDLGFAHLDPAPGVRLGFVDVPGHERFVKNMLAGASGIDLVLLVVAADESIKPQTREHFDICRLLGIRSGVIALTKCDLVDADIVGLARLEIEEFVARSFLEGASIVPVSAATGAGLEELKTELVRVAASAAVKDAARHARLPIDRSFSMRGHGPVVTGTLVSGTIALQDELELYPTGTKVRVRGLQVHGGSVERATAGERTAVNLSGLDASHARRGMTLAPAGIFRATGRIDCAVELLPGAHPLKHRARVHFHAGTAETEADVRLIDSLDPVQPGSRARVRFLLRDPLLLIPGDRFIMRMFSPVATIGGGTVIDIDRPERIRRADLSTLLMKLEQASPSERVLLLTAESTNGMSVHELIARTGYLASEIYSAASRGPLHHAAPQDWIVTRRWLERKLGELREFLAAHHRRNPLKGGCPKEELRGRVLSTDPSHNAARRGGRSGVLAGSRSRAGRCAMEDAPPFLLETLLREAKDVVAEGENVRLASHRVALQQDEERALARMENVFANAGLTAPSLEEVLAQSGVETSRARTLLQILLRDGRLVRVSADLVCHSSALEGLRRTLAARKSAPFTVGEFKEWTGVSRKYAIPLLEFLDRERVTRREGDRRVVS
jgi:selenocysteine-specific elongation factor